MDVQALLKQEWLEADGNGGFASGTAAGIRTRRYHAWLLVATTPPSGRMVLVNGAEVWARTAAGTFALSSQQYAPDVVHPDGIQRLIAFDSEPWPQWRFRIDDEIVVEQQLFVPHGQPTVVVGWRLVTRHPAIDLFVRPLVSGRDYHALHHENPVFRFDGEPAGNRIIWRPYPGVPAMTAIANGSYAHDPVWYRNFLYEQERERGLDHSEDLASPGLFHWELSAGDAWLILSAECTGASVPKPTDVGLLATDLQQNEARRRRAFPTALHRAAEAYIVQSRRQSSESTDEAEHGLTIIAGYPWFTDWGRDTFIALRGLCLATGRFDVTRAILLEWAGAVSEGMLPNRFPDAGIAPEYNAVDASLWFIVAVYELLKKPVGRITPIDRRRLVDAIDAILTGYTKGTRYRIHVDRDGLLAAGEPGVQLTWMDAKVGDRVVTPRVGKPVEVEALWINALWIASQLTGGRLDEYERAITAFTERFWNDRRGCLYDVIDCDHRTGIVDATIRPNQIFAIGGLPIHIIREARARRIVDLVEERLWTPLGLRSLAPDEPWYVGHYDGGMQERDGAYHQGTVWPWLMGPFVEAWVRTRGNTEAARRDATRMFLPGLRQHLHDAGLGHISEIADAEPPYTPRGCPFQAWSLGEFLRLQEVVLRDPGAAPRPEVASDAKEG